ncbi:DOMON-like domain-containing protein [Umezakia ovalisporum]|jgi:hypothetical protein|uniref:DOMON-like domain-containing protein n=2 Tax=Umezakia ovalisporum TaxID=75695 RepID=A0AA43GX09_9CYAN|nr:DOMON-like domain-containing protein [Umezakia ovalisporum]MDH6056344.1 DOMON-like domain-containing protein [Umezakia ovalisporum FSS-43]MDH6063319.1 DOMON-like domain-containing protein [Umezakia ovalisporum FSS-62]MDH6068538.1 DOMON-like domain-containing protein [Umezakia ovalisporum APH033B]MDH6072761.1 DOMON-like domain-containing protein [Umezakia ovalisporum CobakiLakeA]MDH6076120.1 DOMON-like domain-containing protein [Umezakia ovalisporum CS-1034]
MTNQTFALKPFVAGESLPNVQITGSIARYANQLSLRYQILGDLKPVIIPRLSDTRGRKDELWENTCFEFFLGIVDSTEYWEFNLSPAGHWNVYHFDGYRRGMQEETAFEFLPFSIEEQSHSLTVILDVDLGKIIADNQVIDVGITSVILCVDNQLSYWALTHEGGEADFHLRDSFIIQLSKVS